MPPRSNGKPGKPRRDPVGTRSARHAEAEARLPHERDQSSDSQQQQLHDERLRKASKDVAEGRVDTGRSAVTQELAREHFPPAPADESAP